MFVAFEMIPTRSGASVELPNICKNNYLHAQIWM